MSIYENKAAEDVIAERQRQVSVEGWTPQHDDEYDGGRLAAAASAYALYAGDELHPESQGDGDFGRAPPDMWPFHMSWWKPEDPRRALVKAGALILAEIERIDRAAHKSGLIQPLPVERDGDGWWSHPDYLKGFDEESTSDQLKEWIEAQQLQTRVAYMESEVSSEEYDAHVEAEEYGCSKWEPDHPGEGWFCLSIHDTEDGPVCVWGRRV